jgi:hypothetical protein
VSQIVEKSKNLWDKFCYLSKTKISLVKIDLGFLKQLANFK